MVGVQTAIKTPLDDETYEWVKHCQETMLSEAWSKDRIASEGFHEGCLAAGQPISIKFLHTIHEDTGFAQYAVLDPVEAGSMIDQAGNLRWSLSVTKKTGRAQVLIAAPITEPITGTPGYKSLVAARVVYQDMLGGKKIPRGIVMAAMDLGAYDLRKASLKPKPRARPKKVSAKSPLGDAKSIEGRLSRTGNDNLVGGEEVA